MKNNKDRAVARVRLLLDVQRLVELGVSLREARRTVASHAGVSVRSLLRWAERVEGQDPTEWADALAHKHSPREIDPRVLTLFREDYLHNSRPAAAASYARLQRVCATRGLEVPGLRRLIAALRRVTPEAEILRRRQRGHIDLPTIEAKILRRRQRGHIDLPTIEEQGVTIFPIHVFRNNHIPILYTQLGFVRKQNRLLSNHTEDGSLLRTVQAVAAGNACVSELERPTEIIVKAEFPGDISSYTEESDFDTRKGIAWRAYCWKTYDVECLLRSTQPAEAVSLGDAGIEEEYLESLAAPTSCIPFLEDTVEIYQNESGRNGYILKGQRKRAIQERERILLAQKRLEDRKRSPHQSRRANRSPSASPGPRITKKLRHKILLDYGQRCISCGKDSSIIAIEVDHIIPRNLIKNLNLDDKLHTAPENLAAMCIDCNRGKSGRLTKGDIQFYLQKFSALPTRIMSFVTLARLQTL